jgi:bifunctional non-homologous end joining protein LigD
MPLHPRALPAGFVPPCLPSGSKAPPSGKEWLHEIKHDGFRVIARKVGERVKLYSRPGNEFDQALSSVDTRALSHLTKDKQALI